MSKELTIKDFNKMVKDPKKQGWLKIMMFLKDISDKKTCYMCKTKFPNGILNKYPKQIVPIMDMLKGDFLFHMKSTHGIDPDMFYLILKRCANRSTI